MADANKAGFHWVDYPEDGSGSMETRFGNTFYSYDLATDEIEYPTVRPVGVSYRHGLWTGLDTDNPKETGWRREAEEHYVRRILPREEQYMDGLAHGVYFPYFKGDKFEVQDWAKCGYVVVDAVHGLAMSKDKLADVACSMQGGGTKLRESVMAHAPIRTLESLSYALGPCVEHGMDKCIVTNFNARVEIGMSDFVCLDDLMPQASVRAVSRNEQLAAQVSRCAGLKVPEAQDEGPSGLAFGGLGA